MRLAAVCAVYGGYDLIPPVPEGFDDCVLVTDVPVRTGWRNVVIPSDLPPRLAAKLPRCLPDDFTACEASVWMDGSAHVRDGRFATVVRGLLEAHDLVLWRHPEDRDCLYQEAAHCWDWPKYAAEPLREQIAAYRDEGMPEHFGLWATGCVARRHTSRMRSLGEAWLAENRRWSIQDQVSLPYLLWREGIRPGEFGLDQLENDLVSWVPHAEEIRGVRQRILALESRIIHLEHDHASERRLREEAEERFDRLRGRRGVRVALRSASLAAPLLRLLRGSSAGRGRG